MDRMLNVAIAEVSLGCPGIMAPVDQRVAASVATTAHNGSSVANHWPEMSPVPYFAKVPVKPLLLDYSG